MRIYRFPYSTNVERVALALGHKGLTPEWVDIDPADRAEVERVSGQPLVPVLVADAEVVHDSMEIVRWIEDRHPGRPLYPADRAARARMYVFIDWFNRVWKVAPNAIAAAEPGDEGCPGWVDEMKGSLDIFDGLLTAGPYLFGDEFSAADCAAFPFLKYGLYGLEPADTDPFHAVLVENLPLERHPRVCEWVRRVNELPRA